jgi:hypothetical protein
MLAILNSSFCFFLHPHPLGREPFYKATPVNPGMCEFVQADNTKILINQAEILPEKEGSAS